MFRTTFTTTLMQTVSNHRASKPKKKQHNNKQYAVIQYNEAVTVSFKIIWLEAKCPAACNWW